MVFSFCLNFIYVTYLIVFVYALLCVGVHTYLYTFRVQNLVSGILLYRSPPCFLRQSLSEPGMPSWLDGLTSEILGSTWSRPLSSAVTDLYPYLWLFMLVLEIWTHLFMLVYQSLYALSLFPSTLSLFKC